LSETGKSRIPEGLFYCFVSERGIKSVAITNQTFHLALLDMIAIHVRITDLFINQTRATAG
jgi:hypothetical protein